MNKLALTYELMGAMSLKASDALKQDALNRMADANMDVSFVDNTDKEVNLVLPFYDGTSEISSVRLDDEDTGAISGGELFILCVIGIGLLGASAVCAGIGGHAAREAKQGREFIKK